MVLTRLKNASVIHGFHEERVSMHMTVTRTDKPGDTVSAANFDGDEEEVQVRLVVELLPPKVSPTSKTLCIPDSTTHQLTDSWTAT